MSTWYQKIVQQARDPKRRAAERGAWRSFFYSIGALGVAFLLAVYSDVLAREGSEIGTAIAGSTALLLAGVVGVVWVPRLARRTSVEWLRASVDYHITRGGMVYFMAIFVVAIAALNTGNNMLFLILAAMVGAILVSGVVSRVVLSGITVEVVLPDRVFARQPVLARVHLANRKPLLPTFSVLVGGERQTEKDKKKKKKPAEKEAATTGDSPLLRHGVYFPYVHARQESSQVLEVVFPKRGLYHEERIALSSRFPFGFLEKVRKVPAKRDMLVLPSIEPTESFYEMLPMLSGEMESYLRGRGNDLYSIRDYQNTDTARHVDWKASAHTGVMKVREFTREDERRLQLVFDRSMGDLSPDSLERFEAAVDQCAALAWHFQEIGAQLQFVTDESRTPFAPAADIFWDILEYLARVQPGGPGVNWNGLAGAEQEEQAFRVIFTPALHGMIPTHLWTSAYFVFMHELPASKP
jgi:uncharacterized protein (DUF58 family)